MRLLVLIISALLVQITKGQTPQQWLKYAENSEIEQDYYGASVYYQKALELDQTNVDTWFNYAMTLKKTNDCQKAAKAFQEVFDRYEESKYEVSQYWLAEMQKCQGIYDTALINFRDYVRSARLRSMYEYAKAKQEVESTQFALDNLNDSLYKARAVPGEINSPLSDFCPRVYNDSLMLFSSLQYLKKKSNLEVDKKEKGGLSRMYYSVQKDSSWGEWKTIEIPGIEEGKHIANACYGPEGNLFFSICEPNGMCKIYRSDKMGKSWSEARPLGDMINIEGSSHTQPYVCDVSGTTYLFYSSNQPRGRGQMDIWYSKYDKGRKAFARPRNMGRAVNTPGDEVSPYWDDKKSRIYFSSNWHEGYGGFDVHYCEGIPKSLSPSKNAGLGINSSANDLYFSKSTQTESMYLASNREGGESLKGMQCCNDIYIVDELEVEEDSIVEIDTIPAIAILDTVPKVMDSVAVEKELEEELVVIQSFLPLALYFHNDEPNPRSWATSTDLSYDETFDAYYNLLGRYKKQYASLFIGPKRDTAELSINRFFEEKVNYGKQTMDKALDALLHQLRNEKEIEITIKGFASPLARSDYNLNLTKRRIASFKNYISKYEDGAFNEFFKNGSFNIVEQAFGESQSDKTVSDAVQEEAKSIYSLEAAKERRIEILRIERK